MTGLCSRSLNKGSRERVLINVQTSLQLPDPSYLVPWCFSATLFTHCQHWFVFEMHLIVMLKAFRHNICLFIYLLLFSTSGRFGWVGNKSLHTKQMIDYTGFVGVFQRFSPFCCCCIVHKIQEIYMYIYEYVYVYHILQYFRYIFLLLYFLFIINIIFIFYSYLFSKLK